MIKQGLISFLFGIFGGMIFVIAHNMVYSQSIATVRVSDIISEHLEENASRNLSQKDRESLSRIYAATMENVIKKVSEDENVTLLVAPAVVGGMVPDYTDHIKQIISKEMRIK